MANLDAVPRGEPQRDVVSRLGDGRPGIVAATQRHHRSGMLMATVSSADVAAPAQPGDTGATLRRGKPALLSLFLREINQWLLHKRLARRGVRLEPTTLILGECEISGGDIRIGARSVVRRSLLDGRGGLDIGHDV